MEFSSFEKFILLLKEENSKIKKIYEVGIDLINFVDQYHEMIRILITEIYGESGYDWFTWFCHENNFGTKGLEAWDENKTQICYDVRSLWEFLEENKTNKR